MGPGEPATTGESGPRELSLRETAREGEVIVTTARRCWRDGELTGAKRNSLGHVRVPGLSAAALRRAKRERPVGLSVPSRWSPMPYGSFGGCWRSLGRMVWYRQASIPPKG